jgi:hypothetical protein
MGRKYPGPWLTGALCLGVLLVGVLHVKAQELTRDDINRTIFEAERGFAHVVQLWKDMRFAELYEHGTFASQVDLSPEGFVRYMGYATRMLQCCWETIQDLQGRFDSLNRVYVKARLGFKNKEFLVMRGQQRFVARGFVEEETLTFLMQFEDQRWRIDLFRVLALSGVPLELPGHSSPFFRPY